MNLKMKNSRVSLQARALSLPCDASWCDAVFGEAVACLLEDKDPDRCISWARRLLEEAAPLMRAQARLLLGHAERAAGRRAKAIFHYQALARRSPADDWSVLALAALVEIGEPAVSGAAKASLRALSSADESGAALELLKGGEALEKLRELIEGIDGS